MLLNLCNKSNTGLLILEPYGQRTRSQILKITVKKAQNFRSQEVFGEDAGRHEEPPRTSAERNATHNTTEPNRAIPETTLGVT